MRSLLERIAIGSVAVLAIFGLVGLFLWIATW